MKLIYGVIIGALICICIYIFLPPKEVVRPQLQNTDSIMHVADSLFNISHQAETDSLNNEIRKLQRKNNKLINENNNFRNSIDTANIDDIIEYWSELH